MVNQLCFILSHLHLVSTIKFVCRKKYSKMGCWMDMQSFTHVSYNWLFHFNAWCFPAKGECSLVYHEVYLATAWLWKPVLVFEIFFCICRNLFVIGKEERRTRDFMDKREAKSALPSHPRGSSSINGPEILSRIERILGVLHRKLIPKTLGNHVTFVTLS